VSRAARLARDSYWVHGVAPGYSGARGRFAVILGMPVLPIE
jgi:hypothetical protein